ncbi:MAG TPA: YHS domain-containing protein [Candidatus Omnitrophota bacterium]|nr:YHS domain-containing protein [Candidatus Omnitrophota bacterium]
MKFTLMILTMAALVVVPGIDAMAKPGCGTDPAAESVVAAPEAVAQEAVKSLDASAVNVGNKICPVSGQEIGAMGEAVTVEYEGKVYNLCCAGCLEAFNNDPQKYIAAVNAELEASK